MLSSITKRKHFLQYKNTQIKKLKHLISRSSTTTDKTASRTTKTFNTAVTPSTSSNIQDKWVINLSKKKLTPEEKALLQKGPKICSYPSNHPHQRIHLHYYCGSSFRQVKPMVLTVVASTMMSTEFLTPSPINQYIQTSPNQNI